ncbi:uncharacterized protein TNCV_3037971 [Trichonephila clavipes]|nr:uncharacterized protein TNCV_3037971 [Trichonephila clavipes]
MSCSTHRFKKAELLELASQTLSQGLKSILTSHYNAPRGLLVTDLVILNLSQMTRMTYELALLSPYCRTTSITQLIIPEKRRRYDFDQSRRVLLSSDLHSISVLMAQMETDPPDITNSCEERNRLSLEIKALDIVINRCTELVNFPDTDDNHEMKAILRASIIDDTQRKKDTMKTARSVSPLPSEPVTVNNSFSDLESENAKDQVAPEENNETAPPKPSPLPQFILKLRKISETNLNPFIKKKKKFPDITNKLPGEFIKLITNDIEEYHALTNFLEEDKDFEFFSLKPKPIKPIKIVIKGLPIFTKTHEIQSDLEEAGFTIENVSQLISKKTKTALPFFQVTLPRNANNQNIFDLKTVGYMQVKIVGYLIRGITQCFNCNNFFYTAENCHLKPRCLKCGKEHTTRQCPIKERQENPFCINCKEYGHSA